jgi:hypothetical protein
MDFFIKKNLIFEKHFIISLYLGMGKQIPLWNYPDEHKLWNLKLSSLNLNCNSNESSSLVATRHSIWMIGGWGGGGEKGHPSLLDGRNVRHSAPFIPKYHTSKFQLLLVF